MSMTSKNMSLQELNKPILLQPVGKDYLWGGDRLRREYGKDLPEHPLAESWECSTHPDGTSVVASGAYAGKSLAEVIRLHPEWLGERHGARMEAMSGAEVMARAEAMSGAEAMAGAEVVAGAETMSGAEALTGTEVPQAELPILIKLIDAAKDLSVQVHPDDAYAAIHEGQMGKTEMWYVLDAEPDAKLIYGFSHDMTKEQVRESLTSGKILSHLQQIPVRKNDVFYIKPGTIHAIGKGVLVAEIQESSNVTYRVYDYERLDKNGEMRPLHIEKALDVLEFKHAGEVRQQMRLMRYQAGAASEILCRCQYFQVNRVLVTECFRCRVETISFQVFLILEGEMQIGELEVKKGDCVFLPANCGDVEVRGKGQLLQVFC